MKLRRLICRTAKGRLASRSIALLCAVAWGQTALAQTDSGPLDAERQTGSALYSKPKDLDDPALAGRFSKSVARYSLQRAEGMMRKVVQFSDPVDVDLKAADLSWHRVERVLEECMADRSHQLDVNASLSKIGMSFTMNRLRALLVEEIYLEGNGPAPAISPEASMATNRQFVSTGDGLARARGLADFSDCLVYRDAVRADALLRTDPGSPDELETSRALASTLSGCLIEGQTIAFSASSIRALAADGLWARSALGSVVAE